MKGKKEERRHPEELTGEHQSSSSPSSANIGEEGKGERERERNI